ncbi:MAG: protein jag [Clostridia bacterium]|nr:protein jag [Clostridia bacterium]
MLIHEAFGEGATIEEAFENALKELNADENKDVKKDVLELPSKKVLGLFGGSPARVRVWYEEQSSESAVDFLKNVLVAMGAENVNLTPEESEDGLNIKVECEDNSLLIGRHGDTLDALQYLTGLVANKGAEDYCRVSLDVGDYREKREKSLSGLARKLAFQVVKTGKSVTLEPMNPYERRIIHTTVQGIRGAKSSSIGEGADRKVVISLEDGFKPSGDRYNKGGRGGKYGNRGGYNKKDGHRYPPRDKKYDVVEKSEPAEPREPRSDLKGAFLYGKIESND